MVNLLVFQMSFQNEKLRGMCLWYKELYYSNCLRETEEEMPQWVLFWGSQGNPPTICDLITPHPTFHSCCPKKHQNLKSNPLV